MKVKINTILLLFYNINRINASDNENNIKKNHISNNDNLFDSKDILNSNNLNSLNSWIDNDDNFKKLIHMILLNNFNYIVENELTLTISNIYQFWLFKKTLFSSSALKFLLNDSTEALISDLKNIETNLIYSILPFLTLLENKINELIKNTSDGKEILIFIKYILLIDNDFNKLQRELKKYIINSRANIAGNEIYIILFKSKNIKSILARYNVFISSIIEIYCRTLMIFNSEIFMKAIYYFKKNENVNIPDRFLFFKKINKFINDLIELSHLVYYNADRYNKLINQRIIKIQELFGDQISPITSDQLTNFSKKILMNTNIIEDFKIRRDPTTPLYYLSNLNVKNCISFKKTKNGMLECCKETFPELKILNVNLKKFNRYQSVINHIKIKIRIAIILKRDENLKFPVVFCSYKLIPTIIRDTNFCENFNEKLKKACSQIKNVQKDITIKYEKYLDFNKRYEKTKKWRYFNIIEEKKNYIFQNILIEQNIKEYITMGINCLEGCDKNGNLSIRKVVLDVREFFYRFSEQNAYDNSYVGRFKKISLYPSTESIQKSVDQNSDNDLKFYSFEGYIYNPKIIELKKRSYILSDIIFEAFDCFKHTEKIMITTSNFTTDWFETNILNGSFQNEFFDVVPYKYISAWMTYITFRSILKNKICFNEKRIEFNKDIIEGIHSIIRIFEIFSMETIPFYNTNNSCYNPLKFKKINTAKKILYWSDEMNMENQKAEMEKINNIRFKEKKFNLLLYELEITLNQHKVGNDNISIIRIDTYVTRIVRIPILWNIIHERYKIACNTDIKNKNFEQLRTLAEESL